ncbi:hypothetical protein GW7_05443 [Heterocephalus glaber]|uniref:Uncharacterized protein n=1 Tax=Heterocephalus glaber TaxID=10181 RepID=G5B262_HETGA|nr:hypothetical protein GW7_05443 [Heterocephalus glaber]
MRPWIEMGPQTTAPHGTPAESHAEAESKQLPLQPEAHRHISAEICSEALPLPLPRLRSQRVPWVPDQSNHPAQVIRWINLESTGRAKVLAHTQGHEVADSSSSTSGDFSYEDKFLDAELHNSPEDTAETHEMVPSSNLDAGENFSVSEHLACISSSSKCIPMDEDGPGLSKRLLNHDLMEKENFSFMAHSHLPSFLANNPLQSATSTEKKKVLNVYYKPVPMKRGMASLGDTEDDLEPPAKMTRIARMTFPEKIPSKASLSSVCLRDVLTDSENGLHREGQEEREEAENLAQYSVLEDL